MDRPEEIPYCFWHPDVPSEQTLQQLLEAYPEKLYYATRSAGLVQQGDTRLYITPSAYCPRLQLQRRRGTMVIRGKPFMMQL
jgi:hypothetical protein